MTPCELAAVITVTANCEGTLTLAGTVHVLADGKFAHDSETVPLYAVGEFTVTV